MANQKPYNVGGRSSVFWTEEKLAKLNELAAAGKGNTVIARVLGTTRNAVIGKRLRLKLPSPNRPRKSVAKVGFTAKMAKNQEFQAAVLADEPAPMGNLTIATAGTHACRWIAGEPTSQICGHRVAGELGTIAGSYCAWHLAHRIMSPAQPKKGALWVSPKVA